MGEIIPFDFEEQAVRVVLRDGEPWFVAADVCRVLEIGNPSDAVGRLEDDERMTLDTIEGQTGRGGARMMNIISESGLYALIFTSRKEAAKRFRKWVTSEVLPSIRRHGRYELPEAEPQAPRVDDAMTPRDWLALIREARILGGGAAGRRMWARSPFPSLTGSIAPASIDPAEAVRCLHWLTDRMAAPVQVAMASEDPAVHEALARVGLRLVEVGVFVGNAAEVFHGSPWGGGAHRALLLSLPGVFADTMPRRLAGVQMRGIVLPFAAFAEEAQDAA